MMKKRILIKIGGAALESDQSLSALPGALHSLLEQGHQICLVHGGGPAINTELRQRGITWNFVNGQRVTTPQMMNVIDATLNRIVNTRLVGLLQNSGLPVLGFSGAEKKTFFCTQASLELGRVGQVKKVNAEWLEDVFQVQPTPIPLVSPVGHGLDGEKFNINADWAASHLAVALHVDEMIFLTDQKHILDEEGQPILHVDQSGMEQMIEHRVVSGGMLVKTQAILHALKNGISSVRVMKPEDLGHEEWLSHSGTHCFPNHFAPTASQMKELSL